MVNVPLQQREHLLAIWARDRLGERETVEWAVGAIKEIRGPLGQDTAALLALLDKWAAEKVDLSPSIKNVWRLLAHAARESRNPDAWLTIHELKQKAQSGVFRPDDVDVIIECFRPRLNAKELSGWVKSQQESSEGEPLAWVHWRFTTSIRSSHQTIAAFKESELSKLPADVLNRIVDRGTSALLDALEWATALDWIGEDRDLPNYFVHRIYMSPSEEVDGIVVEDHDPDAYNNNFAPILRLISIAFLKLARKDGDSAKGIALRWKAESEGLLLRLFALAAGQPDLVEAGVVASWLESLDEPSFWRWIAYPEIATLRAARWNDLPVGDRQSLEDRLLGGPSDRAFRATEPVPDVTKLYHRDHELARLLDNGCLLGPDSQGLVSDRRAVDPHFPAHVDAIEKGQEAVRARWVPSGDPDVFAGVGPEQLGARLLTANTQHNFERGNDAEAFARTLDGKARIVEALEVAPSKDTQATMWRLLLSYPNDKALAADGGRGTVERIAAMAVELPTDLFADLSDELCYWLDYADEAIPGFAGADKLWADLLPYAANKANEARNVDKAAPAEVDMSMAALNEPLGHLLSVFLRRCPDMPADGTKRPPLPAAFADPLKLLTGRARELLGSRMVVVIPYFARASMEWLEETVLTPMVSDSAESDRLWEAFAKYAKIPAPDVWSKLESASFRNLRSPRLSPEAKRRLAEISVLIWIWSKEKGSGFVVDLGGLRGALSLTNDDVRGAAAWRFASAFRRRAEGSEEGASESESEAEDDLWPRLGEAFFNEIWPFEPALQSPNTANDFARIPSSVGKEYFADAVNVLLPYLLPFEVWAVTTEFGLDPSQPGTKEIIANNPEQTLVLLAVSLSEQQKHPVYDLNKILDWIEEARPELENDYRMRMLRGMA